uniref:Uncharacterized protein n=1 Tax=Glossina brevipalpis TaxID=37001 RepID=A0A1A9W3V9_9MUSC
MFNLKVVILSVILVAHYTLATPIPEEDTKQVVYDEEMAERIAQLIKGDYNKEDLSVKDEYILFVINESKKLYEYFHEESTKLSEDVLADKEVTENEDEDVKDFVKKLSTYLEMAKSADNVEEKLTSLVYFYKLMEKYETEDLKDPTKTDFLIEGYLKKHGMEKFDEEFEKRCNEFLKEFLERAEEVKKTFNEQELEKYSIFIEILEELKKDLSIESRLDLLFAKIDAEKEKHEDD